MMLIESGEKPVLPRS